MKNINRINLVLGFGLVSSLSFGQAPKTVEKTPAAENKEIQERKQVKSSTPTYEKQIVIPVSKEVPVQNQDAQPIKKTEVISSEPTSETNTKETETKQVAVKKPMKAAPIEVPVSAPSKPPKN